MISSNKFQLASSSHQATWASQSVLSHFYTGTEIHTRWYWASAPRAQLSRAASRTFLHWYAGQLLGQWKGRRGQEEGRTGPGRGAESVAFPQCNPNHQLGQHKSLAWRYHKSPRVLGCCMGVCQPPHAIAGMGKRVSCTGLNIASSVFTEFFPNIAGTAPRKGPLGPQQLYPGLKNKCFIIPRRIL